MAQRIPKKKPMTDLILARACGWIKLPKTKTWERAKWQDPRGGLHQDLPMFTVSPTDIIREILDRKLHFSVRGPLADAPPFRGLFHAEIQLAANGFHVWVSNEETPALALCWSLYNCVTRG